MEMGWKILEAIGSVGAKFASWEHMPKLFKAAQLSASFFDIVPADLDIQAPKEEIIQQILDNVIENGEKAESLAEDLDRHREKKYREDLNKRLKYEPKNGKKPTMEEFLAEGYDAEVDEISDSHTVRLRQI